MKEFLFKVTPFSKGLALLIFVALPFLGFYLGRYYQKEISKLESPATVSPAVEQNPEGGKIGIGTLTGHVALGPICPVERPDSPCRPTLEMYKARKLYIQRWEGTWVEDLPVDSSGNFILQLQAGKYTITSNLRSAVGRNNLPQIVTIESDKTTTLNISIDTGIR